MHTIKKILAKKPYQKLIRYTLVGGCTTLISFGVYWFLYKWIQLDPNLSNMVSILCAVIFAYIANKIFVFKSKCKTFQELIIEIFNFFSSRIITILVEISGVFFLYTYLKINPMLSKIIVNGVVLILNYLLSQYIVFKNT